MKPIRIGRHLIRDPGVCHGKLTFKGTRVPVETVLNRLGKGSSIDDILKSWPELTRTAISEAVSLATATLVERYEDRGETVQPDKETPYILLASAAPPYPRRWGS